MYTIYGGAKGEGGGREEGGREEWEREERRATIRTARQEILYMYLPIQSNIQRSLSILSNLFSHWHIAQ